MEFSSIDFPKARMSCDRNCTCVETRPISESDDVLISKLHVYFVDFDSQAFNYVM